MNSQNSSTAPVRHTRPTTVPDRRPSRAWVSLLATTDDVGPLIARLALGVAMFPHGAQKLFGWFGGRGFAGTMDSFTDNMGIPWVFAFLAIAAESFGALSLIVGLLGRIAALGIGAVMVVAVLMVHHRNGFFMNWSGSQAGEGFEYHILAIALVLVVMIKGSGAWSFDLALARKRSGPNED